MSNATQVNAKEWYEFFKVVFTLYPEIKVNISNEFIMAASPQLRYVIAALGEVTEETLIFLSQKHFKSEEDLAMLAKLSKEAHIRNNVVEELLKGKMGKKMLSYVSENESITSSDAYLILHMNIDPMSKNFVARNISDENLLQIALSSKDLNVLEGLLYNKNISSSEIESILKKLKFASPAILAAARNVNTPYDFLLEWSKNNDTAIQRTLATNSSIPYEIQDILSSNADERTLMNLAQNPSLDIDIQNRFLASLYSDTVRFSLAENAMLSPAIANQIFNSEIPALRAYAISKSKSISTSILYQLAADEDHKEVIKAIGIHPNSSTATWEMMLNRALKLGFSVDSFFFLHRPKDLLAKYESKISQERRYLLSLQSGKQIRNQSVCGSDSMDFLARTIRLYHKGNLSNDKLRDAVDIVFAI
jgi:hypothetical protein